MNVCLGPIEHRPQAQLEGFKARALRHAPVRAARDLYVTEWRRVEGGGHEGTADADGSEARGLLVLGGTEADCYAWQWPGVNEVLSLKDDATL